MPANRRPRPGSGPARPDGASAASGPAAGGPATTGPATTGSAATPHRGGAASRTATAGPGADWRITVPGAPALVAVARCFVRAVLGDCPRAHDAELVVSELMTNAIRHTPSGAAGAVVRLRVSTGAGWARVEVADLGDAAWRRPSLPGADEECGRGLAIICALADRAGRDPSEDGQTSWAEFAWDAPAGRGRPRATPPPAAT